MTWTEDSVPPLDGRLVVVTGANSGIGLSAARLLARRGAHVVLACRSPERGAAALDELRAQLPDASLELAELDLSRLSSVRAFAARFRGEHDRLDALCNNAGVMAIPRQLTEDGFEMQLGVNHLGHFALTGLLLPQLLATEGARVVSVSSTAHRIGRIRFDDLMGEQRYEKWRAYGQSKLANLLFAFELQRRLSAAGASAISVACHPGYAATNLQFVGPQQEGARVAAAILGASNRVFAQHADRGAWPTVYAATAPDVEAGDFIGPDGFMEMRGAPTRVRAKKAAHDVEVARALWERSVELTGVSYDALD